MDANEWRSECHESRSAVRGTATSGNVLGRGRPVRYGMSVSGTGMRRSKTYLASLGPLDRYHSRRLVPARVEAEAAEDAVLDLCLA